LAVAEYYFDNDLLFAAKTNYGKVLEDEKSSQYPYALYKLGYVHYNLREYDDSIKSFQRVVQLSEGKDKRKVYFKNQAFSALALSFAEVPDGWKRARDYFRKVGDEALAIGKLESIARIFGKQDKTDLEIEVYEYLISSSKTGRKVPEYADYVTKAIKKGENIELTEKSITRFLEYMDPKGSWYVANTANEEAMTRASQYREEETDWLISTFHTKAQEVEKLKDQERADQLYAKAAQYYEKYLVWFPKANASELYEKEFFLAEIYFFQTKQWDKASDHYKGVVTRDPKGKYSKESAYAVILCKEEKMADAGLVERPRRQKKGRKKKGKKSSRGKAKGASVEFVKRKSDDKEFKPLPEKPLHGTENEFLEACSQYLDLYPDDKEVPGVAFRAAEIFIKKGHYGEGIKRLEVIMEHHSKHKFAGFAAATLFDANYRLRRWDQMERWGRYMLKRKNFQVLNKKQLRDVIAISINEFATELNAKGEKDRAAKEMLRFVKEFPKHDKAAIALFNAAAITEQAERTEAAIDLYESLIKRYKKSPQATEAHFVLGALYESQTDFETAAGYFEKMASFPDVPQMADALYNAGAIRAALEEHGKAVEIFQTYVKKFPAKEDTPPLYLQIAEFQEKQEKWKDALGTYGKYLKKYAKTRAHSMVDVHLRMALVHQKAGKKRSRRDASRELDRALKAYKRLPDADKEKKEVRRAAARAQFLKGEYIYQDFDKIQVAFPMSKLRRSLVKKAELQQKLEKTMFAVTDYKSHDVNAGALFRIGQSYFLFAQSLFDLPIPAELNEDEQIVYRAELDDKAAPLQEKAIEALGRALQLAHENHVYNEWSRLSATYLVKLSPEKFPVLDDKVVNTEWPVPATFSTTFIADPQGKLEQMLPPKPAKPAPAAPAKPGDATPAAPADKAAPTTPAAAPTASKGEG
jgi:cellulose synthase operon protein C